jgi:uncharacterized protein (DUF2141 family)
MKQLLRASALMLLVALGGGTVNANAANPNSSKGNIVVSVRGLRSSEGVVRWALYGSADSFSDAVHSEGSRPVRQGTCAPEVGGCSIVINGVPHGDYAFLMFHDEDNDNEMDKRTLGLPKERVGISNYSSLPTRKPVWRKARFTHNQSRTPLTISTFR